MKIWNELMQSLHLCHPPNTYIIDTGVFGVLDVKNDTAKTGDGQAQLALDADAREVVG